MMAKSEPEKFDIIGELLSNYGEMTGRNVSREILSNLDFSTLQQGTIHLRRQHVLGGEGCPHVPMVERSQYIRIKNPLQKHFAGIPMVGGRGQKS